MSVHNIFLEQRVKNKMIPELFDNINLMNTIYVDPRDRWSILVGKTVFNVLDFSFIILILIVIKKCDPNLLYFFLPTKTTVPGGRPAFFELLFRNRDMDFRLLLYRWNQISMGFCPKWLGQRRRGSTPILHTLILSMEKAFSLYLSQ